jgi:hypothetical protein
MPVRPTGFFMMHAVKEGGSRLEELKARMVKKRSCPCLSCPGRRFLRCDLMMNPIRRCPSERGEREILPVGERRERLVIKVVYGV